MGNFYVNVALKNIEADAAQSLLERLGLSAFISPTVGGYTIVAEKECEAQDPATLDRLAAQLSSTGRCTALAVLNHDDDLLVYYLYERGALKDTYCSLPSLFDESKSDEPEGGDAAVLAGLFGVPESAREIESVLRAPGAGSAEEEPTFVFEIERHERIASLLRMPPFVAGFGYEYARKDDVTGLVAETLLRTGDAAR